MVDEKVGVMCGMVIDCGRIVLIQLDKVDRRIFTPTLHGSPSGNAATTAAVPRSESMRQLRCSTTLDLYGRTGKLKRTLPQKMFIMAYFLAYSSFLMKFHPKLKWPKIVFR